MKEVELKSLDLENIIDLIIEDSCKKGIFINDIDDLMEYLEEHDVLIQYRQL